MQTQLSRPLLLTMKKLSNQMKINPSLYLLSNQIAKKKLREILQRVQARGI